jgi:hypothetical protein
MEAVMRARLLIMTLAATMMVTVTAKAASAEAAHPTGESVDYHQWSGPAGFGQGRAEGLSGFGGGLRITHPVGTIQHTEPALGTTRTYEYGTWTSPLYRQGFGATELISSWNATTPAGTWLQVEARGHTGTGKRTAWYVMGRWAGDDGDIQRTSVDGQSDANAEVDVDTLSMKQGVTLRSYQLRVTLYRAAGTGATPTLSTVGAMTSYVPDRFDVPSSPPGRAAGIELPVPAYAQNIHKGQFPRYGGGGENWCSPTSTEMVVEYWGRKPSGADMWWIPAGYPDPSVAYAARHTYDYGYQGTGNWPFNAAYAGSLGLHGHVTRLRSMAELEGYIARGIPVVTSQSFTAAELEGAGYGTSGHLMVVIGFTGHGDVIVNDPASSGDDRVRNVYKRAQFERVWLRTERYTEDGKPAGGTGGIAYIITWADVGQVDLPAAPPSSPASVPAR